MNNVRLLPSLMAFAEVAKVGSFTAAAQTLGLSKSAVSQQIKRLEEQLGQQLLSRNTRGLVLTSAGDRLLARSELLKDQVELAFDELKQNQAMPNGPFSVTAPHSCVPQVVIPALKQLTIEFPGLSPRLHVSDEVSDLIRDKLDVAIYAGDLPDSNYRAMPLASVDEIFCAAPSYIAEHGEPRHLEALREHRLIATPWQRRGRSMNEGSGLYSIRRSAEQFEPATWPVTFFAETNTFGACFDMALAGMGIVLIPRYSAAEAIGVGQLLQILPDIGGRVWPFHLVHRYQRDKPVYIDRFHQLLIFYFQKLLA